MLDFRRRTPLMSPRISSRQLCCMPIDHVDNRGSYGFETRGHHDKLCSPEPKPMRSTVAHCWLGVDLERLRLVAVSPGGVRQSAFAARSLGRGVCRPPGTQLDREDDDPSVFARHLVACLSPLGCPWKHSSFSLESKPFKADLTNLVAVLVNALRFPLPAWQSSSSCTAFATPPFVFHRGTSRSYASLDKLRNDHQRPVASQHEQIPGCAGSRCAGR